MPALLWMPAIMAGRAERDKVARLERELRVCVVVLDVVDKRGLRQTTEAFAVHAEIAVAAQHGLASGLPCPRLAELCLGEILCQCCTTASQKKSARTRRAERIVFNNGA